MLTEYLLSSLKISKVLTKLRDRFFFLQRPELVTHPNFQILCFNILLSGICYPPFDHTVSLSCVSNVENLPAPILKDRIVSAISKSLEALLLRFQ